MDYQIKKLGQTRIRNTYSFLGIICASGIITFSGKWFGYVAIEEELIQTRYLEFEEWNYTHFWGSWGDPKWEFVKIIK